MKWFFSLFLTVLFVPYSYATVIIDGTRVIYPESDKEISVALTNKTEKPYLVQSWIDDGDSKASPSDIHVPFILTPPVSRVNSGNSQALKIIYTGDDLPKDRESVFWLNVLSVPPVNNTDTNSLQIAYRTRIKLFFRPDGLVGKANQTLDRLELEPKSGYLTVKNPSPYHVSVTTIVFVVDGVIYDSSEVDMMAPYSSVDVYFPEMKTKTAMKTGTVILTAVNDFGSLRTKEWDVK